MAPEILKYFNPEFILEFSNNMIIQQVIPNQWLIFNITPFQKSGNIEDVETTEVLLYH